MENDIFWSEIGSGFEEPGGTPLSRIPRSTPPPPGGGGSAEHFAGLRATLQTVPEVLGRSLVRRAKQNSPQQNWNSSNMFLKSSHMAL